VRFSKFGTQNTVHGIVKNTLLQTLGDFAHPNSAVFVVPDGSNGGFNRMYDNNKTQKLNPHNNIKLLIGKNKIRKMLFFSIVSFI